MENKEILSLLKSMQQTLQLKQKLENGIANTPVEVQNMENDTIAKQQMVKDAEEALKDEKLNNSRLEGELKQQQDTLSNKNLATLEVKTNEQLWAIQKEIEFLKEKISDIELEIITSMEEIDSKEEAVKRAQELFKQHKAENDKTIVEMKANLTEMEKEVVSVNADFEDIQKQIPDQYARLLSRIQAGKPDGVAMSEVKNEVCLGCNYGVRPQAFLEVKLAKTIHQCSNCSRILYYEETKE